MSELASETLFCILLHFWERAATLTFILLPKTKLPNRSSLRISYQMSVIQYLLPSLVSAASLLFLLLFISGIGQRGVVKLQVFLLIEFNNVVKSLHITIFADFICKDHLLVTSLVKIKCSLVV